jgi:hypothetical protein
LWALAKAEMPLSPSLVECLSNQAELVIQDFDPQSISNMLWALATAGVRMSDSLVDCLLQQAELTFSNFGEQDISNSLWALATLYVKPPTSLLGYFSQRAEEIANSFILQGISNILWAISVLHAIDIFSGFVVKVHNRFHVHEDWDDMHLSQLHQFFLSLHYEYPPEIREVFPPVNAPFVARCRATFVKASQSPCKMSQFQHDVSQFVRCLACEDLSSVRATQFVDLVDEAVLEEDGGGYSVDILLVGLLGKPRVCVEVDGPMQFDLQNHKSSSGRTVIPESQFPPVMNGATRLKHRLLKCMGWLVLQVPYFEWDEFEGVAIKKEDYVRNLFKLHGIY